MSAAEKQEEEVAPEPAPKSHVVGQKALNFSLTDHQNRSFELAANLKQGPLLLVFYPFDFSPTCTTQLCNYRDSIEDFKALGIRLVGISSNETSKHAEFVEKHSFPFPLLSDPKNQVAITYGCRSLFMLGLVSRAVAIVSPKQILLYRYVEPTYLSHRKPGELLGVIRDLKQHNLL